MFLKSLRNKNELYLYNYDISIHHSHNENKKRAKFFEIIKTQRSRKINKFQAKSSLHFLVTMSIIIRWFEAETLVDNKWDSVCADQTFRYSIIMLSKYLVF